MKGLSRTAIKYIITLAMALNHAAQLFMPEWSLLKEVLISIGYVTAITMSFFLVEGFSYTHDKKKYVERLFIFALISQLPFDMAFRGMEEGTFFLLNFMFSLAFSGSLLYALDEWEYGWKRNLAVIAILLLSTISDWDVFSLLFVLLFRWAGKDRRKQAASVIASAVLFGLSGLMGTYGEIPISRALTVFSLNTLGMSLAAIFITVLYNGEKGGNGRKSEKWFFYAFYPAHLFILALIRLFIF